MAFIEQYEPTENGSLHDTTARRVIEATHSVPVVGTKHLSPLIAAMAMDVLEQEIE
jgi:hypothetical protein